MYACLELKKSTLVHCWSDQLNKSMFEKSDSAAESQGLLFLINLKILFNLIMLRDIFKIFKIYLFFVNCILDIEAFLF